MWLLSAPLEELCGVQVLGATCTHMLLQGVGWGSGQASSPDPTYNTQFCVGCRAGSPALSKARTVNLQ